MPAWKAETATDAREAERVFLDRITQAQAALQRAELAAESDAYTRPDIRLLRSGQRARETERDAKLRSGADATADTAAVEKAKGEIAAAVKAQVEANDEVQQRRRELARAEEIHREHYPATRPAK